MAPRTLFRSKQPVRPRESLHGDATLHTTIGAGWDAAHLFAPSGSSCAILGIDPNRDDVAFNWDLASKRGHGLCFSSTGGGKNTNLITPALLTYGGSALVLDVKGENCWITAPRRRAMGQRTVTLAPWGQVNRVYGSKAGVREPVDRFNPLSTLDPRSVDFADDVALIADGVIITPPRADPHWTDSARELSAGLIAASVEKAPGFASFGNVRHLLTAGNEELSLVIQRIIEARPHGLAARKLARFAANTKEISSIRSTAETQTAIFDAARLLDSMETDDNQSDSFDLADLVRRRVTLYLVLPADKLNTHGRWMRLIIQLALRAIAREATPPSWPVLFLLDELGTINPGGGLPMIEQAYGLLGGLGIRIWGFFQTLNQLKHDYPNSWQTFIGNCEAIQLMTINDMETAEYFSKHLGNKTWWSTNTGNQSRPVMLPQELMRLKKNEVVTLFAGQNGVKLPTCPYFLERRFAGMYRPNPLYAPPPTAPAPALAAQPQPRQPPPDFALVAFKAAEKGFQAAKEAGLNLWNRWQASKDGQKPATTGASIPVASVEETTLE